MKPNDEDLEGNELLGTDAHIEVEALVHALMKPAHEWDWDYIQTLPIGEFDWLEAKGLGGPPGQPPKIDDNKVRETLAKVISAFANTGGGRFIWGVKDPDAARAWVVENGGIPALYGKRATGDWLEDIIPNLMDAPLRGFNVYTVREAEGLADDHVLFIIDVQDSSLAPHQNTVDNKYYGRVGGKSKPLGHRFVMDIFGRQKHPQIEVKFWIEATKVKQRRKKDIDPLGYRSGPISEFSESKMWVQAVNEGKIYANYISLRLEIPYLLTQDPKSIYNLRHAPKQPEEAVDVEVLENTTREIVGWERIGAKLEPNHGPARYVPLLPSRRRSWQVELVEDWQDFAQTHPDWKIRWILCADNAIPIEGEMLVSDIKIIEKDETDNT